MRVFILGASGYIGGAVLEHLVVRNHSVLALARSDAAERRLIEKGAQVIRGDLRDPTSWSKTIHDFDAIIHVAATFTDDMGDVDRRVVKALVAEGSKTKRVVRFVYTGGCWLYGETGDSVATEDSPFDPLPAFAWMVENGQLVLDAPCFDGMIIHPAMVYDRDGGAVSRFLSDARDKGRIEVIGSPDTRWPVVHRDDLATAYGLAVERGRTGTTYNVAAEHGVKVGDIARVVARRSNLRSEPLVRPVPDAVADLGAWAAGPALDQQMSAGKISHELGWRPQKTDVLSELA